MHPAREQDCGDGNGKSLEQHSVVEREGVLVNSALGELVRLLDVRKAFIASRK